MIAVPIYEKDATDFSSNGLGFLFPISCEVEGAANGIYELTIEMPIDESGKYKLLQPGRIISAKVPTPAAPIDIIVDNPGQFEIWKLSYRYSQARIYAHMDSTSVSGEIRKVKGGEEMRLIDTVPHPRSGTEYAYVQLLKGGQIGYIMKRFLEYVRTEEAGADDDVVPDVAESQLFRIYSVETDTGSNSVIARAMHIFYDLRGSVINADYSPVKVDGYTSLITLFYNQLDVENCPFAFYAYHFTDTVTGTYSYRNFVDCLLGNRDGMLKQLDAHIMRDNYNIFIVPNDPTDRGIKISRGKNLASLNATIDTSNVVTRIIPVGKDNDDSPLFIDSIYVDSSHINDYPVVNTKRIDYDIKYDTQGEYRTRAAAKAALEAAAQREFTEKKVDLPARGMTVDFVMLENTVEYGRYSQLQKVYLYDIVTVEDSFLGISEKLMVSGFNWDVLLERYNSLTIGTLLD